MKDHLFAEFALRRLAIATALGLSILPWFLLATWLCQVPVPPTILLLPVFPELSLVFIPPACGIGGQGWLPGFVCALAAYLCACAMAYERHTRGPRGEPATVLQPRSAP